MPAQCSSGRAGTHFEGMTGKMKHTFTIKNCNKWPLVWCISLPCFTCYNRFTFSYLIVQTLMEYLFCALFFVRVFTHICIRGKMQRLWQISEGLNRAQPTTLINIWHILRDCYGHAVSPRPNVTVLLHTIAIYVAVCKNWASILELNNINIFLPIKLA